MGQVLGEVGELPNVYTELEINFFLLRRLLGVRTTVRCLTSVVGHMACRFRVLRFVTSHRAELEARIVIGVCCALVPFG